VRSKNSMRSSFFHSLNRYMYIKLLQKCGVPLAPLPPPSSSSPPPEHKVPSANNAILFQGIAGATDREKPTCSTSHRRTAPKETLTHVSSPAPPSLRSGYNERPLISSNNPHTQGPIRQKCTMTYNIATFDKKNRQQTIFFPESHRAQNQARP